MNMDYVIDSVKQCLLEHGSFPPTLFVELDHDKFLGLGIPQSGSLPTAEERAHLRFMTGRLFAQKIQKRKKALRHAKVTAACDVVESWYTTGSPDGRSRVRPSLDPERKECLLIVTIDAETMKQGVITYDMIRAGNGKLVDLLLRHGEDDGNDYINLKSPGLPSFLAGVRTAQQDMSQAIHTFQQTYNRYAAVMIIDPQAN